MNETEDEKLMKDIEKVLNAFRSGDGENSQNTSTPAPENNREAQDSNSQTPENNRETQDSSAQTPENNTETQDSSSQAPENNTEAQDSSAPAPSDNERLENIMQEVKNYKLQDDILANGESSRKNKDKITNKDGVAFEPHLIYDALDELNKIFESSNIKDVGNTGLVKLQSSSDELSGCLADAKGLIKDLASMYYLSDSDDYGT